MFVENATRRRACALNELNADLRAREVEAQMTDDGKFSLLVGLIAGASDLWPVRDER